MIATILIGILGFVIALVLGFVLIMIAKALFWIFGFMISTVLGFFVKAIVYIFIFFICVEVFIAIVG